MTDNYYIIVPLMSATVMSTFLSQRLSKDSMYTVKLTQRGIHISEAPEVNLMDAVTVADAMDSSVEGVSPEMPVPALVDKMTSLHETGFPVLDEDQNLLGIVTARDVEGAVLRFKPEELRVKDICTRNVVVCRPEETLSTALASFGTHSYGRLPVIDPLQPRRIIGVLKRQNIISACVEARLKSDEMLVRAEQLQALSKRTAMVIESVCLSAGSPLAGNYVREASFPPEAVLGAIRRGDNTVVPRGSTLLLPGDELVLLTTREHQETVCSWLQTRS